MQSGYTGHIVPAEWRWVILVGSALVLLAFAPFIWIVLGGAGETPWQFMGMLHDYPDGPTYLAKMLQGGRGLWLVQFQHSPEAHNGVFLQLIYPLLGQVARLTSLPPIIVFHVARVGAALIMYLALYQLAASIWMRVRTRRIFFTFVAVGGGLGWLVGVPTQNISFPDLTMPQAFPLASTFVNVHFPLTIACLALLVSVITTVFRPGFDEDPGMHNGGLIAALVSVLLVLLYPEASLLFSAVLTLYVGIYCFSRRQVIMHAVRWLLVIVLPSVPLLVLYATFLNYNLAMAEWNRQNVAPAPMLLPLILGFGIPLIFALPGIVRAIRHFEPDGDQFMLVWLLVLVVAIYLPTSIHQRFAAGMMIPVAYFAARSLEDFWFQYVNRRWRYRLFAALMPFIALSHLLVLFTPIFPLLSGRPEGMSGLFLERDYVVAFQWLDDHTTSNQVILASPIVSAWLPAWANARVVYGHPVETLKAREKKQAVVDWYGSAANCADLLQGANAFIGHYTVKYVLFGPQEQQLGTGQCVADLQLVATIGSVRIYTSP
jgi:hypothetical protein